jgi:hypothetical protein
MRACGRWSRPTPTATASSAPTPGLRGADGFALLDLAEAERLRALGWRGPILLLEGVFEPRDLELCSRLNLWHTVHCDAADRLAGAHKTHAAAPRVPEDEQRHEPAGLHGPRPSAPPGRG